MKTNTIGKKIKLLRKSRNWSQHDVAERLKISIPAFSKIEAGITTLTYSRLQQIVDVFEISIKSLTSKEEGDLSDDTETAKDLLEKIALREAEIAKLQRIAISLYEELEQRGK